MADRTGIEMVDLTEEWKVDQLERTMVDQME